MFYTIQNETLRVVVNECGAELWSIYDKENNREHLWQGEASVWMQRAPMLFPVVGKMQCDTYTLAGKEYTLDMYGFARDCIHTVVEHTDTTLRLRLAANEYTRKQYPFDFVLDNVYTIKGNQLTHAFEVQNSGSVTLPFCIGYHTGYRCFHAPDEQIADCELRFAAPEPAVVAFNEARVAAGEQSILSADGKTMQMVQGLFTKAIITSNQAGEYTFYNRATGHGISVQASGYDRLLLWSGGVNLPFLCIEPWHGNPDPNEFYNDAGDKAGLLHLPAGETYTCAQQITVL